MALADMIWELTGCVPNFDAALARIKLQDAWRDIRRLRGWSFQLSQGGFSTPPGISGGTVTLTFGSPTVIADATATPLWQAASNAASLITQRQFRQTGASIYNIVAYDGVSTITLDRPYTDVLLNFGVNAGLSYLLYQPYYTTPVEKFIRWLAVLDMTNVRWLNCRADYEERSAVNMNDPQRQIYANPLNLLPVDVDQRSGSSTPNWMRYELYPQPTSQYGYMTWYEWEGPDLQNMSDTLPWPVTENLVKTKARIGAYEWAEANKDPQNPRGAGANFGFLMEAALEEYKMSLQGIRVVDEERVNMFRATMTRIGSPMPFSTFNASTGVLSVSNLA